MYLVAAQAYQVFSLSRDFYLSDLLRGKIAQL